MNRLKGVSKTVFYISFPLSFIGFILPVYAFNLGSSPMEIGILYSIVSLCSIIIRPLVGRWIDNKGRRSGFIIGVVAYAVAIGLYLIAYSYTLIFIARVVQSTAASFLWVSVNAMIADVSQDNDRARNFGIIEQCSNKGAFMGSNIGFAILFFSDSSQRLQLALLIFFIIAVYALVNSIRNTNETIKTEEIIIDKKPKNREQFIKYIVIMGILSAVSSVIAPIYLVYLKETVTEDLALISFLYVPGAIMSMFLPARMGKLSDKIGRKKMLVTGMLLNGIFTLLIPWANGYYSFMSLYFLMAVAGLISSPAESAMVSEITGGNHSGRAYGSYRLATGIGGIIGPLVGTAVYQYLGKGTIFYIEGFALLAAAIAVGLAIHDRNEKISDSTNRKLSEA